MQQPPELMSYGSRHGKVVDLRMDLPPSPCKRYIPDGKGGYVLKGTQREPQFDKRKKCWR